MGSSPDSIVMLSTARKCIFIYFQLYFEMYIKVIKNIM